MKKPLTLEQFLYKIYSNKIKFLEKQKEKNHSKISWGSMKEIDDFDDIEFERHNIELSLGFCQSVLKWIDNYNKQYAEWEKNNNEEVKD